jgi:hypothetical protein
MRAESAVMGRRSGCVGMAVSMMTTLFCGDVSRTQMYFSDSMVTWVKVTNCGAMPRLVSCKDREVHSEWIRLAARSIAKEEDDVFTVRASRMAMGALAAAMATGGGGDEIALESSGGWWRLTRVTESRSEGR